MPSELLYRIVDEPTKSGWSRLVVRPFWPWLALTLGGAWVGVPWFIVNAVALGSPTRRKEIGLASVLPFAAVLLVLAFGVLRGKNVRAEAPYFLIALNFVKLLVGYVLMTWQSRSYQLHEHFGGDSRNGMFVLIASVFLREKVLTVATSLSSLVAVGLS